ncbi:MAG TPA: TadE/TadG family type IV pilus assembly protein [Beijerinckiaceae bacterium]|nr:TadE/TadG family type IV pilus assembly protein [Beijerinckiaceae bacterium]
MRTIEYLRETGRRAARFRNDRSGAIAIVFALALLPVVGFIGAAVDYSRANNAHAAMQKAADATALNLSRDAPKVTSAELQQRANTQFAAILNRPDIKNVAVSATYSQAGGPQLVLNAQGKVPTTFIGIAGIANMDLKVDSQAKWGNTRLRVALVLDTTGSMSDDGKMDALKSAGKNLINQLQSSASIDGDVYVSIIPFSKNVNVGPSHHAATWIDWTEWESEPDILKNSKPSNWSQVGPGSSCPFSYSAHGFSCSPTPTAITTTSTIPSSGSFSGYICPSIDYGTKDPLKLARMYNGCYNSVAQNTTVATGSQASCGTLPNCTCSGNGSNRVCTQLSYQHTWIKNARSTWNGCVADRGAASGPSGDHDRKVTTPTTSDTATLFPAEQNYYCSPVVRPLGFDWNGMRTAIDALYPAGTTNQPIGLVWGWQSLVGGGPFPAPPVKDPAFTYREVIVLMSDGLNTQNRWHGNGTTTNTNVDRRMYDSATVGTCANVKAGGITIYAVHVNTDGDPKSTLLENCASGPDKFWMVTSANALDAVFTQIGTELSQLRIAK